MANLPVREMVLYKHGVGFFVRQGEVEGNSADLTFRKDEINDVLKSLAVFDQAGGQILGIHYDTPMDRAHRLKSSSVNLSAKSSLHDLISDLRGRQVTMYFEATPGSTESISGRVIGIDDRIHLKPEVVMEITSPSRIVILSDNGQTYVYSLDDLRNFKIQDAQSEHDLSYFLDTSMTEDDRRVVNLRLSEGDHDLVVYYVAPSPTWRVSYRLVAETEEGGSTGKALLQGWGLFDNRLEEDLDNVQVTLVAGQPISFIYDLYTSNIPHRKMIQEQNRTTGPVEYDADDIPDWLSDAATTDYMEQGFRLEQKVMNRLVDTMSDFDDGVDPIAAASPKMARRAAPASAKSSTKVRSEGKATGETFQYVVTAPVSVKRGESALVPIIGSDVNYERELLYNGSKLANHPVAAIRFENNTGLTLERGPVTVVEDGDYKGEAILPFTKEENQVYLPYAVELGVNIREAVENRVEIYAMHIEGKYMRQEQYNIREVTYTLENTTADEKTITIEAKIPEYYELYETRSPDSETLDHVRWQVTVPAKSKAEFVHKSHRQSFNRFTLRDRSYQNLDDYLRNNWIGQVIYDDLRLMLDHHFAIQKHHQTISILKEERGEIYKKQEEIRKNLGALQPTGQEADLRNRILEQLETAQNRLDEIESEIDSTQSEIERLEAEIERILEELNEKENAQ